MGHGSDIMTKLTPLLAAALALSTLAAPAASAAEVKTTEVKAGALVLQHPWSRETAPRARTGAGYVVIQNTGKEADQLLGGSTPAAERLEVHSVTTENGVMRMRPQTDGIAIPAGGALELKPGGYHIMFINLNAPLKAGATVPVTLEFAKAGKVEVSFKVHSLRDQPHAGGHDGHDEADHDHDHH